MRVRVTHPGGKVVVVLEPDPSFEELEAAVAEAIGAPTSRLALKIGWPPKLLERGARTVPVKNGDSVNAEVLKETFGVGDRVLYSPGNSDVAVDAVVIKRHFDDVTPYYTVGLSPHGHQRQTIAARLRHADGAHLLDRGSPHEARPNKEVPAGSSKTGTGNPGCSGTAGDPGFQRKVVDADNSCLFAAVGYLLCGGIQEAASLREQTASAILSDPQRYTEAILDGKRPIEYAEWLHSSILAVAYNDDNVITGTLLETEVCAIDVKSCQLHKFGELEGHTRRCYLIFDGIHYDALEGSAGQRTFLPADVAAETAAIAFCEKQREKRQYTDTSGFTLRCLICQSVVNGQAGAQEHALKTGHSNFGEL